MQTDLEFDANYIKARERAEAFYKEIGPVYCPYFREEVAFNNKGITHLKFRKDTVVRERKDQFMRLKNIHLAPLVLKSSYTLQEKQWKNEFIVVFTNTRKERILKEVTYYGFISILIDGSVEKRVKVVVRQVVGGIKTFWSIIPYWKSSKDLKLHAGDLDQD